MQKYFITFIIPLLSVLICLFGCQKQVPRPDGMPELVPCKIIAVFGGEKIENVGVMLRPKDSRWGAGGRTNADGVAAVKTAGAFDGAVPGEYTISFSKRVTVSDGKMGGEKSLIPEKYAPGKSTEIITVSKEKSEYVFELDGLPNK